MWSGGVNVAANKPSTVGADGGVFEQNHHNPAALTDGRMSGAYNGLLTNGNLAWARGVWQGDNRPGPGR